MRYIVLCVITIALLSCTKKSNKVTLRGELTNFSQSFMMKKLTPEAVLLDEGIEISTQDNGKFEVKFELDEPCYFKMAGYLLYLSPGDILEVKLDRRNSRDNIYNGDGAEVCKYLSTTPLPKAGSYLKAGQLLKDKSSHDEVVKCISEKVKDRQNQLAQLKNVSEQFIMLEQARIVIDAANSMLKYRYYCPPEAGKSHSATIDEANEVFYPEIKKYIVDIDNAEYLNLEVYKDVCSILKKDRDKWGIQSFPKEVEEYYRVADLTSQLSSKGLNESVVSSKLEVEKQVSTHYKAIIDKIFDSFSGLMPGVVAPDITFSDIERNAYSLDDFKGKIVVIDVWATWCGPCCKEAPFFEEISSKFGSENFAFISISVDSNKETWKKYLEEHDKTNHQYITERINFKNYKMKTIPRFMVIDAEGKIIDAFAAYPSTGLEDVLKNYCSK